MLSNKRRLNQAFGYALITFLLAMGSVLPALGQRLLADGVKDLADQIALKAREQQALRVAVLPFYQIDGKRSVLGAYLAEELFTHLVNSKFDIVERALLDKALGEIELDQTGAITAETAKKLGSFLGADAVITGSITELQSQVAINCRLFDARSGSVFAAAQAKIVKDSDVETLMKTALPSSSIQSSSSGTAESQQKDSIAETTHSDLARKAISGTWTGDLDFKSSTETTPWILKINVSNNTINGTLESPKYGGTIYGILGTIYTRQDSVRDIDIFKQIPGFSLDPSVILFKLVHPGLAWVEV